jgi:septal ring factor EnvC (AmiA/AmiB activator)
MSHSKIAVALCVAMLCVQFVAPSTADAAKKKWTIYERQVDLQKRIEKGEKSNELTKKEADKLRDRMADIKDRVEKWTAKNGGKLTYKDQGKIEKDLNKVSTDLTKWSLEKRLDAR